MGPGDDGHLVDADTLGQFADAGGDFGAGADEGILAELFHARLLVHAERLLRRDIGRFQRLQDSLVAVDAGECARGEVILRLLHRLARQCPDAETAMRFGMARARPIGALVEVDGALAAGTVAEEPGVAVGQAEQGRDLGAVVGAAENPHFRCRGALREGFYRSERMTLDQRLVVHPGDQVAHVRRKMLGPFVGGWIERKCRAAVRSRRAAEAHVDAAGRQGVEHAKDLGHFEWRIVRQHDAGAADADPLGGGGDRGHHDLRCGADDGRMVMVLRHPEALVTQRLAVFGERHRVADGLVVWAAGDGDRLIED